MDKSAIEFLDDLKFSAEESMSCAFNPEHLPVIAHLRAAIAQPAPGQSVEADASVLDDIEEYLSEREDADVPFPGAQIANEEMRLLMRLRNYRRARRGAA
jgi:hypothetical protein